MKNLEQLENILALIELTKEEISQLRILRQSLEGKKEEEIKKVILLKKENLKLLRELAVEYLP